MTGPHPNLTPSVIFGLGFLYLILLLMNVAWTVRSYRKDGDVHLPALFGGGHAPFAFIWGLYAAFLSMVTFAHFTGFSNPEQFLIILPDFVKAPIDFLVADPRLFFAITIAIFAGIIIFRRQLSTPTAGWTLLNASLLSVFFLLVY